MPNMTQRYAHLKPGFLKKEIEKETVNNLMPVIIYLSIMLVSYFKKKIDLETLERFLIKIEMDIYRLGYTEFVTFYGIKE